MYPEGIIIYSPQKRQATLTKKQTANLNALLKAILCSGGLSLLRGV